MNGHVVISGVGTIGPWGAGPEGLLGVLAGGALPLCDLPSAGPLMERIHSLPGSGRAASEDGAPDAPLFLDPSVARAGLVPAGAFGEWLPAREGRRMSRPSRFAVAAARMALSAAGLQLPETGADDLGVILSTTYGPAAVTEELLGQIFLTGPEAASPFQFAESVANAPAAQVARLIGARGPNLTITQREAGTLVAVTRAAREVSSGRSGYVLAGVSDEVVPLLQALLDRFGVLARGRGGEPPVARPFDLRRTGSLTAEGATVLLLEDGRAAQKRGRQPLARVVAGGEGFDPTASRCGWGTGHDRLGRALAALLDRSGLDPGAIDLVVSGASGSRHGDRMEALTLRAAWSAAGSSPLPPVLAPRAPLGALGGGHLATAVLVLSRAGEGLALGPPAGFREPDPALGLSPWAGGPFPVTPRRVLVQILSSGGAASWLVLERTETDHGGHAGGDGALG